MPIQTPATLTYEVLNVAIDGAGACTVLLSVSLGAQRLQTVQSTLDAAACASIWVGVPQPGVGRWADLKTQLYALLRAQGVIPA